MNGPSELDVESVEFIPGASSALYGPNAFNGILFMNSKSPFDFQGISAYVKGGFTNHEIAGTNEYWDVGFINVWSNQKNTFGTGVVNKLINDLVEGENVGSPAFSKNSTNSSSFSFLIK